MNQIATFSIEYVQYLNAKGECTADLPEFAKDAALLQKIYYYMVLNRTFDSKAVKLQRTGKMGTYPSSLGQEAISVVLGAAMQSDDVLCPTYREQGASLIRGVSMTDILLYWGGDERGSDFGAREDFPISVPISTQCLHAAGVAAAFKYRQQKRVGVSVCGDGATSKGDFYEALNVSGAWNLPALFVVNNNQWAISLPRSTQTSAETLAQKAIAGGIQGIQVDGNDVLALYDVYSNALKSAREGKGAYVVEALTYRLSDHTTADDAKRYRPEAELKAAWKAEPIKRLKHYLIQNNFWDEQQEEALIAKCLEEVNQAVEEYLATPKPEASSMFDYLYAELPSAYQAQKDELVGE